jgi:predicted enzyme related to lactoylglutathione lyase
MRVFLGSPAQALPSEATSSGSSMKSVLVLEVDDFNDTIEHLRRHHVPFAIEPFEMPSCRAAIVLDPEGNKLGIHKRRT